MTGLAVTYYILIGVEYPYLPGGLDPLGLLLLAGLAGFEGSSWTVARKGEEEALVCGPLSTEQTLFAPPDKFLLRKLVPAAEGNLPVRERAAQEPAVL